MVQLTEDDLFNFWVGCSFAEMGFTERQRPQPLRIHQFWDRCEGDYSFLGKSALYLQWLFPLQMRAPVDNNKDGIATVAPDFWKRVIDKRGWSMNKLMVNLIVPNLVVVLDFFGYYVNKLKWVGTIQRTLDFKERHLHFCKHPIYNQRVAQLIHFCRENRHLRPLGEDMAATFAADNGYRTDKNTQIWIERWCEAAGPDIHLWWVTLYKTGDDQKPQQAPPTAAKKEKKHETRSGKRY